MDPKQFSARPRLYKTPYTWNVLLLENNALNPWYAVAYTYNKACRRTLKWGREGSTNTLLFVNKSLDKQYQQE